MKNWNSETRARVLIVTVLFSVLCVEALTLYALFGYATTCLAVTVTIIAGLLYLHIESSVVRENPHSHYAAVRRLLADRIFSIILWVEEVISTTYKVVLEGLGIRKKNYSQANKPTVPSGGVGSKAVKTPQAPVFTEKPPVAKPRETQASPTLVGGATEKVIEEPQTFDERNNPVPTRPVLLRNLEKVTMTSTELKSLDKVGEGGEAVVYKKGTSAFKIFRLPSDEFYLGDMPDAIRMREQAAERLKAYPTKLVEFPLWLSAHLVGPRKLIQMDKEYPVGGYEMALVDNAAPLRKYTRPKWKRQNKVTQENIGEIFLDLYDVLSEAHACGMLVGDFKPDNILVSGNKAFIVDAESMAYGPYRCRTYSDGYVDTELCDRKLDYEVLVRPYNRASDWYAYTVMLFQVLTNLHPYEGVYTPESGKPPVVPAARALKRISVFNKNVRVPNFTEGIKLLPKELQHFFFNVFEAGLREKPKREMIALLCKKSVKPFNNITDTCWENFSVRNNSTKLPSAKLESLYSGPGEIISCSVFGDKVKYLVQRGKEIVNEAGDVVLENDSNEFNSFVACKTGFIFGTDHLNQSGEPSFNRYDGPFYYVPPRAQAIKIAEIDPAPDGTPNICMLGKRLFWIYDGRIRAHDRKRSIAYLKGTTTLFGGNSFGLVLQSEQSFFSNLYLLKSSLFVRLTSLPPMMGELTDAECVFGESHVWMFLTTKWEGVSNCFILLLSDDGSLIGMGTVPNDKSDWQKSSTPKTSYLEQVNGKSVPVLACMTTEGIIRVSPEKAKLVITSLQPVTSDGEITMLISCPDGLKVGLKGLPIVDVPQAKEAENGVDEAKEGQSSPVEEISNGTTTENGSPEVSPPAPATDSVPEPSSIESPT